MTNTKPLSFFQNVTLQTQDLTQSPTGSPLPLSLDHANTNSNPATGTTQGGPNTVLRVIVESLLYPVSLDILYQIFQRFGKVLKIVTFTKNNSFQVSWLFVFEAQLDHPNGQVEEMEANGFLNGAQGPVPFQLERNASKI